MEMVYSTLARQFPTQIWEEERHQESTLESVAHQPKKYEEKMKTIRHTHRAGAVWAEGQELPMWTFHMDNGARWGIATTNHGESINNVYKGLRAMPISVIVEMSYWKVNEWRVARLQLAIGRELQGHSIAHDVFAQKMAQHSQTCPRYIGLQPWMPSGQVIGPFMNHGNKRFLKKIGKTTN
ncbi:unnamed protein product [Linum tenue]|uniref:Uncharacterized protein n=1 Tax=Linum tenue TaxID=586396 RepID=A0AAV0M9Q2_9ROSI|nr:unnamed protein product [Linum tenue]